MFEDKEKVGIAILRLTKNAIAKLDHLNRVRRLQKIPLINYDPLEVERLCGITMGDKRSLLPIIKIITEITMLNNL